MRVVLDTNGFISCIGKRSPYRNVFDAFLNKTYSLCLSSEVLLEYEEKFLLFWGSTVTYNLLNTLLTASNTSLHDIFFNFLLVHGDANDNKFADTYIASNADYLVSNDNKLLALRKINFPPVRVITLQEFSCFFPTSK